MLKKLTHYLNKKNKKERGSRKQVNSAILLHCLHEQCTLYNVHVAINMNSEKKVRNRCFSFTAFLTQKLSGA